MPVKVESFDSLDGAARALGAARGARFLGGGTLLMRAVNDGDQSFDTLVRAVDPASRQIRSDGDGVTIGAGVTMAEVVAHRDLSFLAPVARVVGGPAVRNMATVGGNLFASSPYGDFTAALLALGARLDLVGQGGRGIEIDEFLRDRERYVGSIVRAVSVPRPRDPGAFRFAKVSRIKPKGIALMSIAAYLPQSAGRIRGARVAYGSMGPRPLRATAVERALDGQYLDAAAIEQAAAVACDGIEPRTDGLASAWYRREVAAVHLKRLLAGERR
ncbi:FAD binding domain-containing protein [Aquibaculum sediminis]|uniref:FAD binding domain-containing protein n=1 Tax=Aquibaculum sediminis TaxID=3231907 RepID=UPI00345395E5